MILTGCGEDASPASDADTPATSASPEQSPSESEAPEGVVTRTPQSVDLVIVNKTPEQLKLKSNSQREGVYVGASPPFTIPPETTVTLRFENRTPGVDDIGLGIYNTVEYRTPAGGVVALQYTPPFPGSSGLRQATASWPAGWFVTSTMPRTGDKDVPVTFVVQQRS